MSGATNSPHSLCGRVRRLGGARCLALHRGVFPDFAYWAKSAEVMIMVILGGFGKLLGSGRGRGHPDPAQPADYGLHAVLAVILGSI